MKKKSILIILVIIGLVMTSATVIGVSWDTGGNNASQGDVLGTTNTEDLVMITNNNERMRILGSNEYTGFIGIGTSTPRERLTLCDGSNIASEMGVPTEVQAEATQVSGGGLLGTYYYVVSASDGLGFTICSSEVSAEVTGPNNAVTISWNSVHGAVSYRVFGRNADPAGKDQYWDTTALSYTDDGTNGNEGEVPTATDAYVYKINSGADTEAWLLGSNLGLGTALPTEKLEIGAEGTASSTATQESSGKIALTGSY